MAQRGPLVTAIVVVGGLAGLMTANAAGGLVTPAPENAAQQQQETAPPPAAGTTTEPPATTTTAPPVETTEPPATEAPPAFPAEAVYAGKATDSPLAVAVAVKGTDAAAYLCDGANLESWLKGTATDGEVEVASADGTATLTAALRGETLTGEVTFGGQTQAFSIGVAQAPAGLYRGEGADATIGWIVLPDGTQVGILRSGGERSPAPPLDPARGEVAVAGTTVTAEKVDGDTTFG